MKTQGDSRAAVETAQGFVPCEQSILRRGRGGVSSVNRTAGQLEVRWRAVSRTGQWYLKCCLARRLFSRDLKSLSAKPVSTESFIKPFSRWGSLLPADSSCFTVPASLQPLPAPSVRLFSCGINASRRSLYSAMGKGRKTSRASGRQPPEQA